MQLFDPKGPLSLRRHLWLGPGFFAVGLALPLLALAPPMQAVPPLTAASAHSAHSAVAIVRVRFEGLHRSDEAWARTYLGLDALPRLLTAAEAHTLASKLLTTGVFTKVVAAIVPEPPGQTLVIVCEEKWTAIPVVRAQIGGGTPLQVLGAYEIHALGRLLTLGGEMRRYGQAPPGGVFYAKAPRWLRGRHSWGVEIWRDFRRWSLFNGAIEPVATVDAYGWRGRVYGLMPWPGGDHKAAAPWQLGLDVTATRPEVFRYQPLASASPEERDHHKALLQARQEEGAKLVLASVVYDDMVVDNIHFSGRRFIVKGGATTDHRGGHPAGEAEGFYYARFGPKINVALHALAGSRGSDHMAAQYFLGGFDSLRGLPDGALYGPQAIYGNAELRYLIAKFPYLWLQGAVFMDAGGAGRHLATWGHELKSAAGFGIRLAVPQVYRLMLRIDYARGLGRGRHSHGISAGLEQFFQPYRPL